MQFKPKFKPKLLLKKAVAFLTALSLSISLAVSASAFTFLGNSNSSATYTYGTGYTYGFYGQYVSWRLSLYVSTADDGKIDPKTASITGQKGLGYIGSIIYDNFTPNLIGDVYFQTNYTADIRASSIYNAYDSTVKAFPYLTKVNADDKVLYGSAFSDYHGNNYDIAKLTPDGNYTCHNTANLSDDIPIQKRFARF